MSRILTYAEINSRTVPVGGGDAYFNFRRGRLTATFSYHRDYIATTSRRRAHMLSIPRSP